MSETHANAPGAPSAKDVTGQAADWLQRHEFWPWSAEDQTAFDAWLAESLAHRIAYTRLETMWRRTARVAALKAPAARRASIMQIPKSPKILRLAAAFMLLIGTGVIGAAYFGAPSETTFTTAVGERKIITLPDGSRIELNTATTLRTRRDGSVRLVKLIKGEAFFDIRHDTAHPFAVISAGHRITDLGTKFVIRAQPNRFEVSLMEGRAAFDISEGRSQAPIVLTPGDALVVANNQIRTLRKTDQNLANELGWRRGMLIFENTPLGEVAAELNRYNSRKLVIADAHTANIRISASFRTRGTEDFSQLAHVLFGLRVEQSNGKTVISR